jgi:hypothetical protein
VDNALAITTDGRKLALDGRMLSAGAKDFPNSKINALVSNVAMVWNRTAETLGTQMVFADMGVHPTKWGYCPYEEIAEKLIASGIPRDQIAAIGDADSDAKKQSLFDRVRSGQVRVLIGSTQKMGTGTNVQKRLVALHHLDAPWKPAEVEQREGRILRQGNENEEVAIYRYVTEQSFDAYIWQALETKAKFINQIMSGQTGVRRAEDIGGQELSYAEVKAIASGNPAVLTLAEADAELQRLSILKKNHSDEQYLARLRIRELPEILERHTERIGHLTADMQTTAAKADGSIVIGDRTIRVDKAMDPLSERLDSLPAFIRKTERVVIGTYCGLRFGMIVHPEFAPDVYLEGATTQKWTLSREHQGPRAVLNALERLASGYEPQITKAQQERAIAEGQLRDYRSRLGAPFPHDAYLSQLAELRDHLRTSLSDKSSDPEAQPIPDASEIAAQIKSLRAANTIEGTPERSQRQRIMAEEPVTARIRRRTEANSVEGPVSESAEERSSWNR